MESLISQPGLDVLLFPTSFHVTSFLHTQVTARTCSGSVWVLEHLQQRTPGDDRAVRVRLTNMTIASNLYGKVHWNGRGQIRFSYGVGSGWQFYRRPKP